MNPIVFDRIPFGLKAGEIAPHLHIERDADEYGEFEALVAEAERIARPKAVYSAAFIIERGEGFVTLDGVRMESHVMARNFQAVRRVFPYVATCGAEAEAWSNAIRDPLHIWWADAIKIELLGHAIRRLNAHLKEDLGLGGFANMNPGSLPDWPITEQPKLFSLIGDVTAMIGVELTESMLMVPTKSVSGIYFQTESGYENCELCLREECPGRRKPFDKARYDAMFHG